LRWLGISGGAAAAEVRGFAIGSDGPTKILTDGAPIDVEQVVLAAGPPVRHLGAARGSHVVMACRSGYSGYVTGYSPRRMVMSKSPQRRALDNYRSRLTERGMSRFEVIGRDADRALIRSVAKRLAEGGVDADRLRAAVNQSISGEPPRKGGILKALLASRLGGSELDLPRPRDKSRKVDI